MAKLEEVTHFLRTAAAQKGLKLAWNAPSEVPHQLLVDPLRLRQVLLNLLGNAIKFTQKGSVQVNVDVDSQDADTMCLRFAVRDTGPGIPKEKQELIFRPFCQADGSTTRKHGGTGLGLTISAHLVELMGGTIWTESEPGWGSTFYFTGRFGRVQEEAAPSSKAPAPDMTLNAELDVQAKAALGSLNILIGEDNFSGLKLLTRLLERWGQKVALATNGRETIELFDQGTFDLILLDIQMPEMDGFEVTTAIRERERTSGRHTPILAVTAHALSGQREECLACGMDGFLAKPIEPRKLLELMAAAVVPLHKRKSL